MTTSNYVDVKGSFHPHPKDHQKLGPSNGSDVVTVTLMLRRKDNGAKHAEIVDRGAPRPTRQQFIDARGADQGELDKVADFATTSGLEVIEKDAARRSVVVKGTVAAISKAFDVKLNDYRYERGKYRSHDGAVRVPSDVAGYVEAVVGLTDRPVRAVHLSTARRRASMARRGANADPANTAPLTPQQVATLYNFPSGDGAGQTIGLYEMETGDGPAGYALADLKGTMAALGGLPMPKIVDVPIDGVGNTGQSDGETGLDITVAGAIAPQATIAVYFAGGTTQNIIHALQAMIHPAAGQPVPTVMSISYTWGPDDPGTDSFSDSEYQQMSGLFEDAATNKVTVLVSSGDQGAEVPDPSNPHQRQAQTAYPGSDPWVTACGGTTVGNIAGGSFDEWVWNDVGAAGPGATGGGVSARFPVPSWQSNVQVPHRVGTGQPGRGVPDIAGNASENSGYLQVINGQPPQSVGGTSAVAPLYAGLVARINANLGASVGYLNPTLYALPAATFNDILGSPGPAGNSFAQVQGYPAGQGWDACTGFGSVHGQALQDAISASGLVAQNAPAGHAAAKMAHVKRGKETVRA
jgi:kumamolisin